MLYTLLIILVVIAAVLLALAVLMQNSKGGGLSSTFAGTSQIMGVRKTADFLEKATWALSISIVALCFISTFLTSSSDAGSATEQGSKASQGGALNTLPMTAPPAPAAAPAETPATAPSSEPAPAQ
jgi:preprotein translocase subunit SecG